MLVVQPPLYNSNQNSIKTTSKFSDSNKPLLLKPTGVPVFMPVDSHQPTLKPLYFHSQPIFPFSSQDDLSTSESAQDDKHNTRTVRAHSFVIGKKINNQTQLSLIDMDSNTATEKQFPVKVLYMKPSHAWKSQQRDEQQQQDASNNNMENKGNILVNKGSGEIQKKKLQLKKDFPKQNGVKNQEKVNEIKYRPISATGQELKKEQVKRNKLGPNSQLKPQISYVNKVQKQNQRPKSDSNIKIQKDKIKKIKFEEQQQLDAIQKNIQQMNIPFAQNRFQGKFENITKDLIKKAQEAVKQEKILEEKQKLELQLKKDKEKQIQEEIRKMNQEIVEKQKEKGVERYDLRRKEEEKKDKIRKDENEQEKLKRKEFRQKRKEEGRSILGLDMFNEQEVDDYRKKVKQDLDAANNNNSIKNSTTGVTIIKQSQIKNSSQEKQRLNRDLQFHNQQIKELIKEQKIIDEEEENQKVDRKKLLLEQKQRRKQEKLEKIKQDQILEQKKLQNKLALEQNMKEQKEEYLKRKELQQKMKEEQEKLKKEIEKMENQGKKKKKNADSNHNEKINELKNWIDEQMIKENLQQDDDEIGEEIKESPVQQQKQMQNEPVIKVQIDQKDNNAINQDIIQLQKDIAKKQKELPGNNKIGKDELQKLGSRDNRYGLKGDNGYQEIVELEKQKIFKTQQQKKDLTENLTVEDKQKIKSFLTDKMKEVKKGQKGNQENNNEQQIQQQHQQIINLDILQQNQRRIIIEKVKQPIQQKQNKEQQNNNDKVPGVLNIEKELNKQKQQQVLKEKQAVLVIQKWSKGFLTRLHLQKQREQKRHQIEQDYSYFNDQVKFNSDYNLEKFLREKKKLRELNKLPIQDSIKTVIDGAIDSSHKSKQNQQSKLQTKVQNYILDMPPEKDPLSIISIYAKNHLGLIPIAQDKRNNKHGRQSASDIAEEIYTEEFDEDKSLKRGSQEDIDEDIIEGSKGLSSSSNAAFISNAKMKEGHFNYRPHQSIHESIQEDLVSSSMDKRLRKSPGQDSSIAEESHLMNSVSKQSLSQKKSMRDESIKEEVYSYDEDVFDSYQGSISKSQNIKNDKKQMMKKEIDKFENQMRQSQEKRKNLTNEMLQELKRYEQATVSTIVVERMEKIVNQSLNQKDKLFLAQRLHELEMEKQHKDEINKIREEQIKLMSQLMLVGNNQAGISQQERTQMLENIQKIVDKPIIIKQQKKEDDKESSDNVYEERSEEDYIQESKGLSSQKGRKKVEESDYIKESLPKDDNDDISEDIQVENASESQRSDEEIKESVYVDGKKLDNKKQQDKGLSQMRMAFGSEETLRTQSKKTLKGDPQKQNSNKSSGGLFEKNSFEDFTHQKFKELMFDENAMGDFIGQIEQQIEEKEIKEKNRLDHDLNKKVISPRTYNKKSRELEKWVSDERRELKNKKQNVVKTCQEMGAFLNKLQAEKKIMLGKIGSPRNKRLLDSNQSQDSQEFDDIQEESNESIRVREARNQLKNLNKFQQQAKENKELLNKKAAAKKLLEEKEKAIQEGIKQKMQELEQEHVEQLLNTALNLDVRGEIERRIRAASKLIEESKESGRMTESYDNYYDSVRSQQDDQNKKKKKVNFASPERFSSLQSNLESSASELVSSKHKSSQQKYADSIDESIKIEESYNASHSGHQTHDAKKLVQSDLIKESIKESFNEEESSKYSEDFQSQSQISDKKSQYNQQQQKPQQQQQQQQQHYVVDESNKIEYSMNFEEESMGQQSQSLGSPQNKHHKHSTNNMSVVNEEDYADNSHKSLTSSIQHQQQQQQQDEFQRKESDEHTVEEEFLDASGSLQASSNRLHQSSSNNNNNNQQQLLQDDESEDKEILQSATSVEWHYNLEQQQQVQSQRSGQSKKNNNKSEDEYSEQFDEEVQEEDDDDEEADGRDEDVDNLDDLESFPEEMSQSFDEQQMKADKITDEIMKLMMEEIQKDEEFIVEKGQIKEEEFKDKFPFNILIKQEEEEKSILNSTAKKQDSTTKQQDQKLDSQKTEKSNDEVLKENYEKQQKLVKEIQSSVESYMDIIVKNVNKRDLIQALERPLETDPLKTLQRIQALDSEDSQSFNNINDSMLFGQPQQVLSLDHFKLIESLYKAKLDKSGQTHLLTESGEQRKINFENFHHKAVFDAFNEALDCERPYKMKGQPTPWSKQTRSVKQNMTTQQAEKILKKASQKVLAWTKTGAGTKIAPLPPPPQIQNEQDQQSYQPPQSTEEERRNGLREERLGELLTKEIEEHDYLWVDYENEDTQVKFDLADMILEELANEITQFLSHKMSTTQ